MRVLVALALLSVLVACGAAPAARDRLNGTWESSVGPYVFDVAAGTLTRTLSSGPETKAMTIEGETANSVTIRTDGDPIVITFQEDGTALMVQEGKLPLVLTRQR